MRAFFCSPLAAISFVVGMGFADSALAAQSNGQSQFNMGSDLSACVKALSIQPMLPHDPQTGQVASIPSEQLQRFMPSGMPRDKLSLWFRAPLLRDDLVGEPSRPLSRAEGRG